MALAEVGLPAIIRPVLHAWAAPAAASPTTARSSSTSSSAASTPRPTNEVLIEESVLGWKEYEMEVVRDRADNCIIVCSIENIDPMGVHTGDSITVAPALTLTDKEYQIMRDASIAVLREIGVETGGSNVQFAINPENGRMIVIEMNPRVSRSSALASKATGFPIAKVAAKLAVGYTLDEIDNDITGGATPASFEPTIDYVVTKIPRFAFEKFPGAEPTLTTAMKSVGEAMAIGRTFAGIAAEGAALAGDGPDRPRRDRDRGARQGRRPQRHQGRARHADARTGCSRSRRRCASASATSEVYASCKIDPWFLEQLQAIVDLEERVKAARPAARRPARFRQLKAAGFSDARLAVLAKTDEAEVARPAPRARRAPGLQAHRHLRGRVRLADRLHVLDLRAALRRRAWPTRRSPRTARRS